MQETKPKKSGRKTVEKLFGIYEIATAANMTRETVVRAFKAAGIVHDGPWVLAEIIKALTPDIKVARARKEAADAALKERELAELNKEIVRMEEVEKMIAESVTLPLRQSLISVPTTLDVRCNSEHPEVARIALTQWRDETLKLLREKL